MARNRSTSGFDLDVRATTQRHHRGCSAKRANRQLDWPFAFPPRAKGLALEALGQNVRTSRGDRTDDAPALQALAKSAARRRRDS